MTSAHTTYCPWIGLRKVKVVTVPTLPAFPGRELNCMARSRAVRVGKVVHPCRVKSIRIAVSTVTDDLELMDEIIENMN